jgi:hypothetical protein
VRGQSRTKKSILEPVRGQKFFPPENPIRQLVAAKFTHRGASQRVGRRRMAILSKTVKNLKKVIKNL